MTFDDKNYIAGKIREARKRCKYTQAQLAELVNVNEQHISRIENAMYVPSLSLFFKLYKILNLSLTDFGIDIEEKDLSPLKKEVLKIVYSANDKKLYHYKKVLNYLDEYFLK